MLRQVPDNARDCADRLGLDYEQLKVCAQSAVGHELLRESAALSTSRRIQCVPACLPWCP